MGFAFALAAAGLSLGAPAQAADGDAPQVLGRCMAMKTTGEDRILVARWMLVAMASAPQMRDVLTVAPGRKEGLDRGMAALFTRLLVRDCPDAAQAVFKLKSNQAFQVAGESLGRVAVQELLTNPQASAALGEYVKYLKAEEFGPLTAP